MLRLAPFALFALLAVPSVVRAQSESATGLASPPTRGSTYSARGRSLPEPTPSTDLPPPPAGDPYASDEGSNAFGRIEASADDRIEARLDQLDLHLSSLGARRSSGVGGGVVTMLMGGAYIGLGVYANRNDEPSIAKYFIISGVANLLNAGVGFGLQPNTERAYTRFTAMREDVTLSSTERLREGESILRSLARRRMASRFVQGGINLTVTAISLPFLFGSDGFAKDDAFDWIVSLSAVISAVDAVTTMVQRTEEERRWRMYRSFAARHGGEEVFVARDRPRLVLRDLAAAPIPGGGFGAASFTF